MNSTLKSLLFWMVLIVVAILIWQFMNFPRSDNQMAFSVFLDHLEKGQVQSVVITGNEIQGTLTTALDGNGGANTKFRTYAPPMYEGLGNKLADKSVQIMAKPETTSP